MFSQASHSMSLPETMRSRAYEAWGWLILTRGIPTRETACLEAQLPQPGTCSWVPLPLPWLLPEAGAGSASGAALWPHLPPFCTPSHPQPGHLQPSAVASLQPSQPSARAAVDEIWELFWNFPFFKKKSPNWLVDNYMLEHLLWFVLFFLFWKIGIHWSCAFWNCRPGSWSVSSPPARQHLAGPPAQLPGKSAALLPEIPGLGHLLPKPLSCPWPTKGYSTSLCVIFGASLRPTSSKVEGAGLGGA